MAVGERPQDGGFGSTGIASASSKPGGAATILDHDPAHQKAPVRAIEAVLDIAYNAGAPPWSVLGRDHFEREGIPRRYLEPVLQELVREKILIGIRGPSGGYRLARERRRISLGDIVKTVRRLETGEDPIADPAGSALGHEVVRPLWRELEDETMARLDALTLEDLCTRAHRAGIAGPVTQGGDFEI